MKPTRALVRGLDVLEALARYGAKGVGASEIAKDVELDKATVSRLLFTLQEKGYVIRDTKDRSFMLTGKMAELSQHVDHRDALRRMAFPFLEELRNACSETVHLGVMDGDSVVYIEKLETERSVRLVSAVGQYMPISTTALGKAILSGLAKDRLESLLPSVSLPAQTQYSIQTVEQLREELSISAARGYAVDAEENEEGVTCVGAPIFYVSGSPVAAISISGPSFRTADRVAYLGQICHRTATEVSALLSGSGRLTPEPGPTGGR